MSSTDKRRKLTSLDHLISEKTAVETSCGTLYVRPHRTSELSALDELEDEFVGRLVLQTLCGYVQAKQDPTGITEQTLNKLNPQDFLNLVQAVAEQEQWKECSAINDFKELGQTFALQRAQKQKALLERLNSHHGIANATQLVGAQLQLDEAWKALQGTSMQAQLDALNETNRKLQESLSGYTHHGLQDAALMAGDQFQPDEKWKSLQDICTQPQFESLAEANRKLQESLGGYAYHGLQDAALMAGDQFQPDEKWKALQDIYMQPPLQALAATSTTVPEMLDSYDHSKLDLAAQLAKGLPQLEEPLPYIPPAPIWNPPRAEDTPLGKAALQSASELQQIKKWAEKSDQGSAESMRIARNSLRVAIGALVVSAIGVIVAVWPPSRSETPTDQEIPPASNQLSTNLPNATPVDAVKASSETTVTTKAQPPKQPERAKSAPPIQN